MNEHTRACWLTVFVLAVTAGHDYVQACSVGQPPELQIVANPADTTAPSTPVVSVGHVERGSGHRGEGGCGPANNSGSCEGNESVTLQVSAADDVTAANELGYVIESDEPVPGAGRPVIANASGQIVLFLASDDEGDDDLRLDLRIFAVDQAGNMSTEPGLLSVRDEGEGCHIASDTRSGAVWCAAMLALLLMRRARQRERG